MSGYGVTADGFIVKPFAAILGDKLALASGLFGPDADLSSTSALRRILDIASAEDQEHWKALEGAYYANFVSTACKDALDLLGDDLGLARDRQPATGSVQFTLTGAAPGRIYLVPVGTLVETAAPVQRFRTTNAVQLSATQPTAVAAVSALVPGPQGNVAASAIVQVNAIFAQRRLALGTALLAATNPAPTVGGELLVDDEAYRARLLRQPRALFTVDAVQAAVQGVDGVRDCRLSDPLGGVDVSMSYFDTFVFDSRRFGQARLLGTPYFFEVLVAPEPGYEWDTLGAVPGLRDAVAAAVDRVRPIGIFPNIRRANEVVVGVRAEVATRPGMDAVATTAALKNAFERRVSGLGLGNAVVAAEVLCDLMAVAGVQDVRNLHLRRYPPAFGATVFGDRERFCAAVIEGDLAGNLPLAPHEIASFRFDSELIDLQVSDR